VVAAERGATAPHAVPRRGGVIARTDPALAGTQGASWRPASPARPLAGAILAMTPADAHPATGQW